MDLDPEDIDITSPPVKDERSLVRRIALQVLFEADSTHHPIEMILAWHFDERQPNNRMRRHILQLVEGVNSHREAIDPVIQRLAPEFPLNQIAIVDRNILRIAIYEFAISGITPVGAAIDEAVDLAKLFGSDATPNFVNGVLGALADEADTMEQLRIQVPVTTNKHEVNEA